MMAEKVFLDTNVLVEVVNGSKVGSLLIEKLRKNEFGICTFRKCVYELYSILKGTTKDLGKKNNALKKFLDAEINDIAQQLFKRDPSIDMSGNTYFWYNLREEWTYDIQKKHELLQTYADPNEKKEALKTLEAERKFLLWKSKTKKAIYEIDRIIKVEEIEVCEYFQVYSSEWYKKEGFFFEREFAKNSLLPDEDFEIVMAALFLGVKAIVTKDYKGLIRRGGLSLGLNLPNISFCSPEKIEKAIEDNFSLRNYE